MKKQIKMLFIATILSAAAFTIKAGVTTYTFNPNQNHSIGLDTAASYCYNFRHNGSSPTSLSVAFGKTALQSIINQTGCQGIRFYYAIDAAGNKTLICVGVNSNGDDMYLGILAERGTSCFPCTANALNTD